MTAGSAIGSFPGDDATTYAEWVRVSLGELALPVLPELPGRGAIATMSGRGLSVVAELGADLQPSGWRLTGGGAGVDHRRARSLLAQDLDALEEQAQGLDGPLKVQVCGPWTLAATVEKPRGDKLLSDHGARRELAQALAEGIGGHVADVRRRVPGASRLIVQVDEPALPAVLSGGVPTASGFGRHRSVDRPEASDLLALVLAAITAAGGEPWVHSCARDVPWGLVSGAGATGLLVDPSVLGATDLDALAEALESGSTLGLGVVPSLEPGSVPSDARLVEQVERWLDTVGLDVEEVRDRLVVTPSCGLAGASYAWARRAVALAAATARALS